MASVFNPGVPCCQLSLFYRCYCRFLGIRSSYLCCQYLCCLHVRLSVYCNWMAVMVSVFALFCEVVCPSTSVTDAAVCKSAERGRQVCHIYLQACDRLFLWSTSRIHLKFHWRVTQRPTNLPPRSPVQIITYTHCPLLHLHHSSSTWSVWDYRWLYPEPWVSFILRQ